MKSNNQLLRHLSAIITAAMLCGITSGSALAKQGATDPIPGTSKGTTNTGGTSTGGGGGGGGKTTTTTTTTITLPPVPSTPVQPIVNAALTFVAASVQPSAPQATGSYRIDPYYPTLSLLTVTVDCTANVPDNTVLYLTVNGTGGTLYPFTSNAMNMVGGHGTCTYSVYVTPGTIMTSVVISDASGIPYLRGN